MDDLLSLVSKRAGDSLGYRINVGAAGTAVYEPRNFMISGGTADERHSPFLQLYSRICGKLPVIILHSRSTNLERNIYGICQRRSCLDKLFIVNNRQSRTANYEYLQISVQGIVNTLSRLALNQGYQISGQFEIALRSLVGLTKELKLGAGLRGLDRLSIPAYAEFRTLLDRSGLSKEKTNRIAVEMDRDDKPEYYYLFQAIVSKLANEAEKNGWGEADEQAREIDLHRAIEEDATVLLELDPANCKSLLTCIANEILEQSSDRFLLILDGLNLFSEELSELLRSDRGFRRGLIGENLVSMLGDAGSFEALAEKSSVFLIFKHRTGKIAEYFSEIIGCEDIQRAETSEGTSKETFKILPGGVHRDVRYSIENRYRVMPEDILDLAAGQLFLFDSSINKCEKI